MPETERLHKLARMYGIETAYYDVEGGRQEAGPHSLLAALCALGAPVRGMADTADAVREREESRWRRCCAPVFVSWNGKPVNVELRLPAQYADGTAEYQLRFEDGRLVRRSFRPDGLPVLTVKSVEGVLYEVRRLTLPGDLPHGYHRLTLNLPGCTGEALVISAPGQAYHLPPGERIWGVFLPLYALHSEHSSGAGDLTDLGALMEWVGRMGGDMVGTLPLLPTFLDKPFEPSPYSPVSRLFWHEFYLDPTAVEEIRENDRVRAILDTPGYRDKVARLQADDLVDYRGGMALKRRVLEAAARAFFAGDNGRRAALRRWADTRPGVRDYARFRATIEHRGAPWPEWPERMQNGDLREGDYHPEAARYHLYVQWLVEGQLHQVAADARAAGQRLYLDLPLGVHGGGYDVWRERAAFATDADTGAPPDPFNRAGQNWGFAPPHPENIREQGYRYYIACLRHHLREAGVLRIDHAAGLHRLYWIPRGLPAGEGVYVRYRADEFFAILALESHRHRALIVGEDLGTVPGSLRAQMARRKIYGMYVAPFELSGEGDSVLNPMHADSLVCLNTHDMPPFAAFWNGKKAAEGTRLKDGLPAYLHRTGALERPTTETGPALEGFLTHQAAGPAQIMQVNLEDLWLETRPQNIPGTRDEYPNWRRKARYSLQEFPKMGGVERMLRKIDSLRKAPI